MVIEPRARKLIKPTRRSILRLGAAGLVASTAIASPAVARILRFSGAQATGLAAGQYLSPVTNPNTVINPLPFPTLTGVRGQKFPDPTFPNVTWLAISTPSDGAVAGPYYSYANTLNLDNTLALVTYHSGALHSAKIQQIDPVTFTTVGDPFELPAVGYGLQASYGVWSRINAKHLYVCGSASPRVVRFDLTDLGNITYTEIADFTGIGGLDSNDYFLQYSMSDDETRLAASLNSSAADGYVAVDLVGETVLCKHLPAAGVNEVSISRDGNYVYISTNTDSKIVHRISDHNDTAIGSTVDIGHGDTFGTDGYCAYNNDDNKIYKLAMSNPTSKTLVADLGGGNLWFSLGGMHVSMRDENEDWAFVEHYQGSEVVWTQRSQEFVRYKMDGSGAVQRLMQHGSNIDSAINPYNYNAIPRGNISMNGKIAAFFRGAIEDDPQPIMFLATCAAW